MKLSKRLETVVSCVTPGMSVIDVGCDHAYVSVELAARGISPAVIASDIVDGPLAAAEIHIAESGMQEKITVLKSDGIPKEYGQYLQGPVSAVICGMGGLLICRILEEAGDALEGISELVLSPQRDQAEVRALMTEKGYLIDEEVFLEDAGKYYTVIRGRRSESCPPLLEAEKRFGPVLIRKKDPGLHDFLSRRLKEQELILARVASLEGHEDRAEELRRENEYLREALAAMQQDAD